MKTSVIYTRVSTIDQDCSSQLSDLRNWASKNNFQVLKEYGEAVSGYDLSKERTEFDAMKEYCFKNNINTLIVWELSRFGRSSLHTLNQIKDFSDHKINILFYKENINSLDGSVTNVLLLNILTAMAEMERNTINDRMVRGRRYSVSQGKRCGFGILPFGFTLNENNFLIIDEDEAQWIRKMYEWRKQGKGCFTISHELNKRGVQTRFTKLGHKKKLPDGQEVEILWNKSPVKKILTNPLYKGERHYSGNIYNIPQIITRDLWDIVQDTFKYNISYLNRTKFKYLFKGKIKCGNCKHSVTSISDMRYKNKYSYYKCNGNGDDVRIECNTGQFNSKVFDKLVWNMLVKQTEFQKELFKIQNPVINEDFTNQFTYLNDLIIKGNNKKKRIIDIYKDGFMDREQYLKEINKLDKDIKGWLSEISEIQVRKLQQMDVMKKFTKERNIRNVLNRRPYIEKWVDKVIVYPYNKLQKKGVTEKMWWIELYAFSLSTPFKAIISSKTEKLIELHPDQTINNNDYINSFIKIIQE